MLQALFPQAPPSFYFASQAFSEGAWTFNFPRVDPSFPYKVGPLFFLKIEPLIVSVDGPLFSEGGWTLNFLKGWTLNAFLEEPQQLFP